MGNINIKNKSRDNEYVRGGGRGLLPSWIDGGRQIRELRFAYKKRDIVLPLEIKSELPESLQKRLLKIQKLPNGMMKSYIEIEKLLPVKEKCRSQFFEVPNPKGTVVLLHGFSAGTWQYNEWRQQYLERGYNVFIPRLIGNGLVKKNNPKRDDTSNLPKANNHQEWMEYCDQIYTMASQSGLPIHVVGLSGGGTCAAYIAERYPINTVFLMAPYFKTADPAGKFAIALGDVLGTLTFGQSNRVLDLIDRKFTRKEGDELQELVYEKVPLGAIKCLRQFGRKVLNNADNIKVHGSLVTSECDLATDKKQMNYYWNKINGKVRRIHYEKERNVPHTMMNHIECDKADVVDELKYEALMLAENHNYYKSR